MNKKIVNLGIAVATLVTVAATQQAHAATTADTTVNLNMQSYAAITATTEIFVAPTLAQVVAGIVTTTDQPITLTVDSTNGSTITVEGDGNTGPGTLADADLELNAGLGWISAANGGLTPLYTSSVTQSGANVPVNVRISNLGAYEVGNHSNTVTFTIVDSD